MQVKIIAEGEHSAKLLTFIKLPFVIKIFVLSFLSGLLRQVLLYFVLDFSTITSELSSIARYKGFRPPAKIQN